jgi:hypothetical protein
MLSLSMATCVQGRADHTVGYVESARNISIGLSAMGGGVPLPLGV